MSTKPQTYTSSILITGGTAGLGYQTALYLARTLPQVLIIIASRSDKEASAKSINTNLRQSNVTYMPLDLGTLALTRSFATTFLAANLPPISGLILNAGVQFPGEIEYTKDGIEKHIGINHASHALLFHLLSPRLTPDARIIVVSSGLHDPKQGKKYSIIAKYTSAADVAAPTTQQIKDSNGRDRYATSKTANAIWAFALSSHLPASSQKTVLAFDPGLMFSTGLLRAAPRIVQFMAGYIMPVFIPVLRLVLDKNINTPEESGENMGRLVTQADVKGLRGKYYEKRYEREASVQARDQGLQEDLWTWTVEKVAKDKEEKAKFERVE